MTMQWKCISAADNLTEVEMYTLSMTTRLLFESHAEKCTISYGPGETSQPGSTTVALIGEMLVGIKVRGCATDEDGYQVVVCTPIGEMRWTT